MGIGGYINNCTPFSETQNYITLIKYTNKKHSERENVACGGEELYKIYTLSRKKGNADRAAFRKWRRLSVWLSWR